MEYAMTKKLIVFSHNDTDALGTMLNLEYKTPDIKKEYFHTNYANIPEIVKEIKTYIKENNSNQMFIMDVSFSDNKDYLTELYNTGIKITYIDHHLYPDKFFDCYPNMKVIHDKTKSATLLSAEFFKTQDNSTLTKLNRIIDVYDLWQTTEPEFDLSQDLNEYFWAKVKSQNLSIEELMNLIINSGWKLPSDYIEVVNSIRTHNDSVIANYESRGLINRAGDITLCFVSECFNNILISEMQKGKNFVIGLNEYGIIRVRIKAESHYTKEMKNALRLALTGTENIGHENAFTFKLKGTVTFDSLMMEAQKIVTEIKRLTTV